MTQSTVSRFALALSAAAAVLLGGPNPSVRAQGTAAQREACTPDAIRLCQDAIPDVAKTTACMKAHEAALSPACRSVFAGGEPSSRSTRHGRRRVAATGTPTMTAPASSSPEEDVDVGRLDFDAPDTREPRTSDAEDLRNARRVVRRLCRTSILDPDTCRLTQGAINLAR